MGREDKKSQNDRDLRFRYAKAAYDSFSSKSAMIDEKRKIINASSRNPAERVRTETGRGV